ncbi:MAG: hypothetical protein IJE43_18115 [Alphaproteobacteria bacterium]|nr:hypothetical protein [Alphaproteobacteria bacterium]MBQ2937191.1 hypothetical protein [Lachnospiraceae bacterium]
MELTIDFSKVKKKLLLEFIRNGGGDTKTFIEGMTYLQDYIESNQEETRLNEYVPEEVRIEHLIKELERKERTITELQQVISHKQDIIRNFRKMTKKERSELRKSEGFKDMEKRYSELKTDYVMNKGLRKNENP